MNKGAMEMAVGEFADAVVPSGRLGKIVRMAHPRVGLPDPFFADPAEELRRLVKLHANWSRTAVALHHMRSDRIAKQDTPRWSKGDGIPCLLPPELQADIERAQARLEQTDERLTREMARALKQMPIWRWLSTVSGIGEKTGAILVGETDIAIATKPSNLKHFFGVSCDKNTGRLVRRAAGV